MTRLRAGLRITGGPARLVSIGLIRVYRLTLSGWFGGQCRFHPSCSVYAEEAIRTHGAIKGGLMGCWRLARCGPFTRGGLDPVPPPSLGYDAIIPRGERS